MSAPHLLDRRGRTSWLVTRTTYSRRLSNYRTYLFFLGNGSDESFLSPWRPFRGNIFIPFHRKGAWTFCSLLMWKLTEVWSFLIKNCKVHQSGTGFIDPRFSILANAFCVGSGVVQISWPTKLSWSLARCKEETRWQWPYRLASYGYDLRL